MRSKPKLKACTLLSPPDAEPVVLGREVTATSSGQFDGQPDPNSPAQRTLHQSLANRLVGQANVYNWLREFAFRSAWGFQSPDAPGVTITLAIAHQSHGPKVALVIKGPQWSATSGDTLVDQGWHVLTIDSTSVVQTPQEAVSDIVTVLHHIAGLPMGTGDLGSKDLGEPGLAHADDAKASLHEHDEVARASYRAKVPAKVPRKATSSRRVVWSAVATLAVAVIGLYAVTDGGGGAMPWHRSTAYNTTVKAVTMTKEGHAAVTLADGRKAYLPAHTVQRNPNLLHNLIVAWRQGKPLNVFTTNRQHLKYGREIGVKTPASAKPRTTPKPH
jgi:hypothetical protein